MRVGADIAERLLEFGLAALRLAPQLPQEPSARHVAMQMVRSATSTGANYEEARAAESRADFVHKVSVAAKEARESCYWLMLIQRANWADADLRAMVREVHEIAAILGASARTARQRLAENP